VDRIRVFPINPVLDLRCFLAQADLSVLAQILRSVFEAFKFRHECEVSQVVLDKRTRHNAGSAGHKNYELVSAETVVT
jgi:hypothetical protein